MNTTVTLINPWEIPKGKEEEALLMWEKAADSMRIQPGFISTKLHCNPLIRMQSLVLSILLSGKALKTFRL